LICGVSLIVKNENMALNTLKNNKEDYVLLVRKNMKRAYFTALGLLGSYDEAMEISQLAFIRAYKHFNSFDRSKNFFTWYYKILRNLCLNKIRDSKRRNTVSLLEYRDIGSDEDIEQRLENEELRVNVEKAMMQLEPHDREILVLKEFNGMAYKEISEMLHIPIGSVMSRLYYARKRLGKKLETVLK